MMTQENMLLILVLLISGKNSGLSTICFSENTFYTNSAHFKDRILHNEFQKWIC